MVAFIPILASIFAIVGIGQVFKPRLPQYSFQINQLPILKYINGSFKTKLGAGVKLQNDNYVPIDVHSLSFDLYYPNHWSKKKNSSLSSNLEKTKSESELDKYEITNHPFTFNNLVHIGQVQDKYQQEKAQPRSSSAIVTSVNDSSSSSAEDSDDEVPTATSNSKKEPLWEMLPRQLFETVDHVFMELYNIGHLGVMSSLSWDIIMSGFGSLQVPSSGVIQVKANKKIPLTMSIICDNILNMWTLEMTGMSCQLSNIEVGWTNMEATIGKLRNEVLTKVIHPNAPYNIVDANQDTDDNGRNSSDGGTATTTINLSPSNTGEL